MRSTLERRRSSTTPCGRISTTSRWQSPMRDTPRSLPETRYPDQPRSADEQQIGGAADRKSGRSTEETQMAAETAGMDADKTEQQTAPLCPGRSSTLWAYLCERSDRNESLGQSEEGVRPQDLRR